MRRLLRELQENLEEFVAQEGYLMLVLGCEDVALPYVLKTLDGMEAQDPTGVYLNFAARFRSATSYALESMALLHAHREAFEARRPPERVGTPLLPQGCLSATTSPHDRFVEAARYLRGLLASPADQRVVLGLLPTELEDPQGYAELIAQLVPAGASEPWRDAVRIVVRDDLHGRVLRAALERRGAGEVLAYELDLSNEAMQSALARDVADASVPEVERMAAMLQLAMLDYSYRRHREALEKFGVLFSYYGAHSQTGMQALSQLGAADTLRALGMRDAALVRYRSGLVQALDAKVLPVLLNLLLGAAECCVELRQEQEAAEYFEQAEHTARALLNPLALLDAMERRGDMQRALGKTGEAAQLWTRVELGCRAAEYWERLESVLLRQQVMFREAQLLREVDRVDELLRTLRDPARRSLLVLNPTVPASARPAVVAGRT